MRDLCGDGNVLYLDYSNVNIQAMILYYNFIRCYQWGKLIKGTRDLSIISYNRLHVNLQVAKNKKLSFKKMANKNWSCRLHTYAGCLICYI